MSKDPTEFHFSRPVPQDVKSAAHSAVGRAVEDGILSPAPCEVCASPDAVAHHDDYGWPLDVTWLCRRHHAERHLALGHESSHPGRPSEPGALTVVLSPRFTPEEIEKIRGLLEPGETISDFARRAAMIAAAQRHAEMGWP